ncbi:Clp protease ClpP [Nakamurella flava]|uniref:ATP-dependent Clp protease proteolytic subunit n=1 Tax=Nakamurella flava TaxID=2576308 RepID=A0A4U6QN38_9ACTN|nr:head maturation protease, ClpP-related [Nakamurella flava]TKV61861.1 Clp protease ClpP [Nakamurella flava]
MSRRRAIRANARQRWYEIRNEASGSEPAQVLIYGDIGDSWWGESVSASQFVRDLTEVDADAIDFHIHSPGGDAFDGLAIANAIRTHKARTTAYVDGLAASAASYIATAADEVVMGVGAELMIHDAWGMAIGNVEDMTAMADLLGHLSDNIASLYAIKAGGKPEDWRAAMRAETWYSADEAVEAGLADRVASLPAEPAKAAAKDDFDLAVFAHAGRRDAPTPWLPAKAAATYRPPAEPADTTTPTEGADPMSDKLIQGLRARLGVTADAVLDDDGLLAAVDEALNERAQTSTQAPRAALPEGAVLVDSEVLDSLKASAARFNAYEAQRLQDEQTRVVDEAIAVGRIGGGRRDHWLNKFRVDPEGAAADLALFDPGSAVPVDGPRGHAGSAQALIANTADDQAMAAVGWDIKE